MTIIARVNTEGLKNKAEIARAFAKQDCFKWTKLSDVIATMRNYEKCGWLVYTGKEAILYHEF